MDPFFLFGFLFCHSTAYLSPDYDKYQFLKSTSKLLNILCSLAHFFYSQIIFRSCLKFSLFVIFFGNSSVTTFDSGFPTQQSSYSNSAACSLVHYKFLLTYCVIFEIKEGKVLLRLIFECSSIRNIKDLQGIEVFFFVCVFFQYSELTPSKYCTHVSKRKHV